MPSADDVKALRAVARQRRAAATAKIRRLKSKGIDIAETSMDPRRPPIVVTRYNRSQLNAYIRQLNAFTRRDTTFLAGAGGKPITHQKWLQYKSLESKINDLNRQHLESIKNIKLPNQDMTIGQRRATILPDRVAALGDRAERPYGERDRKPEHIEGEAGLDKLILDAQRKLKKEYLPEQIKKSRAQLKQMLDALGDDSFQKISDSLTDHQFNILWNDTNFPNEISQKYLIAKAMGTTSNDRWYRSVIEDATNDIRDLLNTARQYPETPTEQRTRPTRRRKK